MYNQQKKTPKATYLPSFRSFAAFEGYLAAVITIRLIWQVDFFEDSRRSSKHLSKPKGVENYNG